MRSAGREASQPCERPTSFNRSVQQTRRTLNTVHCSRNPVLLFPWLAAWFAAASLLS